MGRKELKAQLEEVKAKIKTNSKDAHFADALISELLSLKGQIDIEPTIVHILTSDIVDQLEGNTFSMIETKQGDAIYKVKGGYTIIADGARMSSLADTIKHYIRHHKEMDNMEGEELELAKLELEAVAHVLNTPMFAFSDIDLAYKIATDVVKWMSSTYEELVNKDLQPEDREADAIYEDGMRAADDLVNIMKETEIPDGKKS